MPVYAWICALFLLVAVIGSATWLALRGLAAWRMFRAFTEVTGTAFDAVLATAASAEQHAVSIGEGSERLTRSTQHLQESLAEAAVLRSALGETQQLLRRLRGAVPHK